MMNDIRAIMENYKEVRNRLRWPPNAVPDTGINLRPCRTVEKTLAPAVEYIAPPKPAQVDIPLFTPFRRTDLTFSSTLRFAAKEFNITDAAIRSRNRTQEIALPRQIAIWLAAHNHLQSLAGMGRYLKMDHSTMIHARDKITSLMASDATLRDRILKLEAEILAAFHRTSVPRLNQPHLGSQEAEGHETVGQVSSVDTGS